MPANFLRNIFGSQEQANQEARDRAQEREQTRRQENPPHWDHQQMVQDYYMGGVNLYQQRWNELNSQATNQNQQAAQQLNEAAQNVYQQEYIRGTAQFQNIWQDAAYIPEPVRFIDFGEHARFYDSFYTEPKKAKAKKIKRNLPDWF